MMPLRGVGARLSLAVVVVVALALALVYAIVVPSLERNLENAKLAQLERSARFFAPRVPRNSYSWSLFAPTVAESASARVILYERIAADSLRPIEDSSADVIPASIARDPVALRASARLGLARGVVEEGGRRYAEVAQPALNRSVVLLLRADLQDAVGNVHFVGRRLVFGGLVALLVALTIGYVGAWAFTRRIRRLEQAAERIAAGRFDEPVVDRSRDELGELARAFDRMRERLAGLDDARREFIANASHELRTPIFALGGSLELLLEDDMDDETRRDFLATMREQVDRLTKLASDLLDLSRLDAGRLRLERTVVDLRGAAEVLVGEFRGVAQAGDRTLEIVAAGESVALADGDRVLQIGRILLENALVHTPPGTTIRVRIETDGTTSTLEVEDEGPGIPLEHSTRVFERFYRVDGTKASGSGLGLAIARELAALMGGGIELHSRRGSTVFRLTLPRAASAVADRHAPRPVPA